MIEDLIAGTSFDNSSRAESSIAMSSEWYCDHPELCAPRLWKKNLGHSIDVVVSQLAG